MQGQSAGCANVHTSPGPVGPGRHDLAAYRSYPGPDDAVHSPVLLSHTASAGEITSAPCMRAKERVCEAGAQADTQVSTTTDFAYPSDSGNMQGRFKTRVFAAKGWLLRVHLQDLAASTSRVKIQREIVDCRCVWCVACNSVTQTTHFLHQSTSSRGRWLVLPHRCASCQT